MTEDELAPLVTEEELIQAVRERLPWFLAAKRAAVEIADLFYNISDEHMTDYLLDLANTVGNAQEWNSSVDYMIRNESELNT